MFKNGDLFAKADFEINIRNRTITCPSGLQTLGFELGTTVKFDANTCDSCPARSLCTKSKPGAGRSVAIGVDEPLQQRMRKLLQTPAGRDRFQTVRRSRRRLHLRDQRSLGVQLVLVPVIRNERPRSTRPN